MDSRKWFRSLPLFGSLACIYCGGPADTSDHTPPRCFLPKPFPEGVQAMTVPACAGCNGRFSLDEIRAAAIICTLSFTQTDRVAVAPGGWMYSNMQRDSSLKEFINCRLSKNGRYQLDEVVIETLSCVMAKTEMG